MFPNTVYLLELFNRLGNLGEEISQIAKRLGEETTVDQLIGLATADAMGEILEKSSQQNRMEEHWLENR